MWVSDYNMQSTKRDGGNVFENENEKIYFTEGT